MFARRATASPGVPFLVVIVLIVAIFFANRNVTSAIMDAEIAKGMEAGMRANPQVTPEQMATGMKYARMATSGGAVIAVPISLLMLGFITWLVARICGGSPGYGTALLISAFAWVPRVLEGILTSIQGILLDTSAMTSHFQLQLGPARFLAPATTPAWQFALLGRLDLITLWVTALFAIGLVHAGKVPKNRLILAGALMWLIGSVFPIWGAYSPLFLPPCWRGTIFCGCGRTMQIQALLDQGSSGFGCYSRFTSSDNCISELIHSV